MSQFISGREIADIKEKSHLMRVEELKQRGVTPKLAIIQTIASPVIDMYVRVKKTYAERIGVIVEHYMPETLEVEKLIEKLNNDGSVHGIIVQLPLRHELKQERVLNHVVKVKDVDGLTSDSSFVPPTVQSILWLLDAFVPQVESKKIALVGRGLLVGAPLEKQLLKREIVPTIFTKNNDISKLIGYDVIISATGVPGLLTNLFIKHNAFVFDAGTAEENGAVHGDAADELYEREDIFITPTKGGVGILTVRALFENVLFASEQLYKDSR